MGLTNTGSLQLQAGQVDVWLASLSNVSSSEAFAYLQLLSEPEQAQWQRFKVEDARLQYLVTRALVRTTLSRYADVPARTWQFETNAYGCPHISQPQASRNLRFNLSNTTGLVACAVSMDCEIGIDVENITRTVDADAVAPSVFAPAELADFREAGLEDRRDRFFSYWTLKEFLHQSTRHGTIPSTRRVLVRARRHISASMRHGPMPRHSRPVALLPACADRRAHDGRCRRRASGCRAFHSPALGKTDVIDRGVGMTSRFSR